MPISEDTIRTTVYQIGNFSGFTTAKVGNHYRFAHNDVRVNLNHIPTGQVQLISPQKNPDGDTIYLSYFQNEVSSVRLPSPAPAGVTRFITDPMSGCKFFIDRVHGSEDLIVYHANARRHSPPGNLSGTQPIFELDEAGDLLDTLHADAAGDYRRAPDNLVLHPLAALGKGEYNQAAHNEVLRKRGQNRFNVEFVGGTIVAGFADAGGAWRFYFQTFGDTEYKRPFYAPKRITSGKSKRGATNIRILEARQFYP